ncbi:MAG: dockerin type I domain-containing protein, partial [bacterium]|nr:dockerin type I domain-containing protein [bacterium]
DPGSEYDGGIIDAPEKDIAALGYWTYGSSSPNAGITALALQAFLNVGITIEDPIFGTTVENAINYILNAQNTSGDYHNGGIMNSTYGYETAMSIVALKSALKTGIPEGHALRAEVEAALVSALAYYTTDFQSNWSTVSWRYNRSYTNDSSESSNGDMSVNQWVYLALDAMDYNEKGVWQKIYNYLNTYKCKSGDQSRIGYYRNNCSGRSRGNTLAGIWGSVLADQYGISGARNLADEMMNYIDNRCGTNLLISHPSLTTDCVYHGAGYYYYIYELAKALEMSGTTIDCAGDNWGETMYSRVEGQHLEDANGYYWNTDHEDLFDNYYIASGGMGADGQTALALLSMEAAVGVIPPGSKFVVKLNSIGPVKDINGAYLRLFDETGRYAGPDDGGGWISNIPGGTWNATSDYQEFEFDLTKAEKIGVEIHNDGPDTFDWELRLEVYTPDQLDPVDSIIFYGTVEPGRPLGTKATVDAVGGLSVRAPQPIFLPCPDVAPEAIAFSPLVNDTTFSFSFVVSEICDSTPLTNINIFASDLVDGLGNIIPNGNFVITPAYIDSLPAAGSALVQGTLLIPGAAVLDLENAEEFFGVITIEAGQLTRSIALTAHTCSPNLVDFILPNPMFMAYANHIGDITYYDPFRDDTITVSAHSAHLYVDGFEGDHLADSVVMSTVRINDTIMPVAVSADSIVPYYGGISENKVLNIGYQVRDFLLHYKPVYDTQWKEYAVTGQFTDGTEFIACGAVSITGHISGDLNSDGTTDITDLTIMISYMFGGENLPCEISEADYNHDGLVDITDLTEMTTYMFSE